MVWGRFKRISSYLLFLVNMTIFAMKNLVILSDVKKYILYKLIVNIDDRNNVIYFRLKLNLNYKIRISNFYVFIFI